MKLSTQQIAVIALVLSQVLPLFGITIPTQSVETAFQVAIAIVSGIWVWYTNLKLHKAIEVGASSTLGGIKA